MPCEGPGTLVSTESAIAVFSDDEEWDSDELEEHDEIDAESEPIDLYDSKLYYPLIIGEVLDERYKIVHKLGWGGCSTVWMAHDTREKKYVALKILVSAKRENMYGESDAINERLQSRRKPGLITYHELFELSAGKSSQVHRVLVFPLLGPNLDQACLRMPTSTHMQDHLNPGAVMWGMRNLDEYDTTAIYRYLSQPRRYGMGGLWKPGDLVKPMTIPETLREDNIYLGDFGMAITDGTAVTTKVQTPTRFCAPERLHNTAPSSASDMWSYMCIFAWLYLGLHPVRGRGGMQVVSDLVDTLGPLPKQWHGCFKYYNDQSDDRWYDQSRVPIIHETLISKVARRQPAVSPEEQVLVVKVFEKVFCYEPTHRWTAAQLLEDPHFIELMGRYIPIS